MSQLRNRKVKDAVAASSEQLSNSINDRRTGDALYLVRYWGNVSGASTAKVVAVDQSGLDVIYTVGADTSKRHEMRIQFKTIVHTPQEARALVDEMAGEARKILGVEVDKSYVSVGQRMKKDHEFPDVVTMFFSLIAWVAILSLTFLEDEYLPSPLVALRNAMGADAMRRLAKVFSIINGALTLVSFIFCLFARIPLGATILWIPTVFVFGVPSLQMCMKVAIRHLLPRYPEFFGIPKGVLPDDPETIKNKKKTEELQQQQENKRKN
ncbi:hypothetical protein HDU96_006833 [Phlyctochytrium bullatum]|nr:hypothetical protein HDU96_006833 [Phlyctochytrium bullatum]